MQQNQLTLGFAGKHSMALTWGFSEFLVENNQWIISFINGDHDRWINGEDLIYEYVHFTKDEIRGWIMKSDRLSPIV